jgi:hypothetical protein
MINKFIYDNQDIAERFKDSKNEFDLESYTKEVHKNIEEIIDIAKSKNDISDLNFDNKSVAVVGNSGIILDSEYGEEIDSHDIVMRCNLARVIGYEKHVGSKTNIRIVSGKSSLYAGKAHKDTFSGWDINFLSTLQNEHIVFSSPRINHYVQSIVQHQGIKWVHYLTESFLNECQNFINDIPSVGLQAIVLATQLSSNIDLYGFNFFRENWENRHYFEEMSPYNVGHSFPTEQSYVEMLESKEIINKIYY